MSEKIIPISASSAPVDVLDTLCDLKWNYPIFNMSRGEFRSCCRTEAKVVTGSDIDAQGVDAFLNSQHQKESRLDLVSGKKNKDCNSCWKLESAGMASPRHSPQKFWEHLKRSGHIDFNVPYSEEKLRAELASIDSIDHPYLNSTKPYMLEINLGNTCDMKCMYCNHHYSSQWGTELIKWGEITPDRYEEEFPKAATNFDSAFWEWFNNTGRYSLSKIGIIGGEPLIMPEFYRLIEKLKDSVTEIQHKRREKITLWIVTNMNTPANYLEKFIAALPGITDVFNLSIYVSMESTGAKAEYIRNGVNWDKFTNNIDKLLTTKQLNNLSFNFAFMPSVNILSISGTKDFVMFVEGLHRKYNIPVGITQNIISFPNWQSPLILTPDFANYLDNCVDYMQTKTDIASVTGDKLATWESYAVFLKNLANSIRNNSSNNTIERRKFADWFLTFDHRRKLNLLETFPEYTEFYKLCKTI